ncbi:hypothetical protein CROQUDRAFT_45302 [Cronartium quercuum f. sp. fusiforme G11]|uniref:Uncharacterized protein n=1 Tax=Cronartium quercuum f. sp. fusiforme G11 TaxID=708437 RepID=A0A9P6NKD3_9BASI|nr:hypothetical protein CROQUDRAFT_45302 [Cronartium quercuum f. sp. fusiforme G11]
MAQQNPNQLLAFSKIQQAIHEDDLWLAAWMMAKFIQKSGYKLMKEQLQWLESEHAQRSTQAHNACLALETIAQHDAREDFANWFDNGTPYQVIMANSWKKHTQGSTALHLQKTIVIYSQATGYLKEIISMAN